MMFLDYDLAKTLLEHRRESAAAAALRRSMRTKHRFRPATHQPEEADVIELVFGTHCETGQIGA